MPWQSAKKNIRYCSNAHRLVIHSFIKVVWKLFAHRLLALLQNVKRRGIFLFLLFLLCLATTTVNVLFSASWFVDFKRNDLALPSRYCHSESASDSFDDTVFTTPPNLGQNNDFVSGVPSFVWPKTASIIDSITACVSTTATTTATATTMDDSQRPPNWTRCDEGSLFSNGSLATRGWWNRVDWATDLSVMWRAEALFCFDSVATPLFLCLFYANICQILVFGILLLVCAAWKLIVSRLAGRGGGGGECGSDRGGDVGGGRNVNQNGNQKETSFANNEKLQY